MRVDYYEYINSPEWRRRADAAKARAGYRCRVCNRHADEVVLNAHHRTYERLGNEDPDDITVLCRDCHELYETHDKSPKKFRKQSKPVEVQPYTLPMPERPAVKSTSTLGSSRPATPTAPVPLKVPVAKVAAKPSTTPVVTAQKKQNILGTILGFIIITTGLIAAIPISSRFVAFIIGAPVPASTYTAVPVPTFTARPVPTFTVVPKPVVVIAEIVYSPVVVDGAEMRSGPGTSYPVVATWAKGTRVAISAYTLCDDATWYRIGQDRWIDSTLVIEPQSYLRYVDVGCISIPVKEKPAPTSTRPILMATPASGNAKVNLAATLTSVAANAPSAP